MIPLLSEVQSMQNPALGAVLIWRFGCGYLPQKQNGTGVPLVLTFIVLPIMLHTKTRDEVSATRVGSGVRKFEEKFKGQSDLLSALNNRAIAMRGLTLRSIRIALSAGLVSLLPEQASIWPRTYVLPRGVSKSIEELLKAAEKLGTWCAPLSLFELSGILQMEF